MKNLTLSILIGFAFSPLWAEDITTTTGKKYTGVTIERAEPDGIVVATESGIEKISFDILSKELQSKYGYDPQKAAKFNARVQAANYASSSAMRQQAAAKTAIEALLNAKPPKGQIGDLGVHILRVEGKVLQVLSDGMLLANEWENQTLEPYTDDRGVNHSGANIMNEPLFVLCPPSKLVDGDRFSGVIYPAGTYTYTSTLGAGKTVRCYAISPQVAAQRQLEK